MRSAWLEKGKPGIVPRAQSPASQNRKDIQMDTAQQSMAPPMVSAQSLRFGQPGLLLWDGASHDWPVGLCLVRGGEGCGKTSLLQMLAGQLPLQLSLIHI